MVEKLLELQTGSSEKQPELIPGRTRLDDQRDMISKESAEKRFGWGSISRGSPAAGQDQRLHLLSNLRGSKLAAYLLLKSKG